MKTTMTIAGAVLATVALASPGLAQTPPGFESPGKQKGFENGLPKGLKAEQGSRQWESGSPPGWEKNTQGQQQGWDKGGSATTSAGTKGKK